MTTKEFQERSDLRIFLSYFKPHKKLFVLDMVCALTIALIDLAFPYLSRWCMYELLPQNAYRTFFTVMAVAAAAFAVRGVLTYIIGYYGHTFGILVEADIRRDLFRHPRPVRVALLLLALFHRFADTGRRCFYHCRRNRRHLDAGPPDHRALDILDHRQLRVRLSLLPAWSLSHNVSLYLLRHTGGSRIIHLEKERNKNK